jgi:hypothetical protein
MKRKVKPSSMSCSEMANSASESPARPDFFPTNLKMAIDCPTTKPLGPSLTTLASKHRLKGLTVMVIEQKDWLVCSNRNQCLSSIQEQSYRIGLENKYGCINADLNKPNNKIPQFLALIPQ